MDALAELNTKGFDVSLVDADRIRVTPADRLDDQIREFIRQHKREIMARLAGDPRSCVTQDLPEATDSSHARNGFPTDDAAQTEAGYGRVCCLRCARLTTDGTCRAKSTTERRYRPLEYVPVMLWRRCDQYRPGPGR